MLETTPLGSRWLLIFRLKFWNIFIDLIRHHCKWRQGCKILTDTHCKGFWQQLWGADMWWWSWATARWWWWQAEERINDWWWRYVNERLSHQYRMGWKGEWIYSLSPQIHTWVICPLHAPQPSSVQLVSRTKAKLTPCRRLNVKVLRKNISHYLLYMKTAIQIKWMIL